MKKILFIAIFSMCIFITPIYASELTLFSEEISAKNHCPIYIYTFAKELTGSNWLFSGFGENKAICPDITNQTICAGIKSI